MIIAASFHALLVIKIAKGSKYHVTRHRAEIFAIIEFSILYL